VPTPVPALHGCGAERDASNRRTNASQGTGDQAASVEETTTQLDAMSGSIERSAEASRETERVAVGGARDAGESGAAVHASASVAYLARAMPPAA
jgi:methyl-accepting chemotaxis protein